VLKWLQQHLMKRSLEAAPNDAPAAASPKVAKAEAMPQDGNENHSVSNVPSSPAPAPSAKEVEAARLARVRLGLEAPKEGEIVGKVEAAGKLPTGQEPEKVDIVHVPSAKLNALPSSEVDAALAGLGAQLAGKNWVETCNALHLSRQLVVKHKEAMGEKLAEIGPLVLACVKNLRSAMQKSALMCVCDMLDAFGDAMIPLLRGPPTGTGGSGATALASAPVLQVLMKAAQDKRFVADEAVRALKVLGETCTPAPTQALLLPFATHKSPKVRAEAAAAMCISVARLDSEALLAEAKFSELLALGGALVSDKDPKARAAAHETLALLYSKFTATQDAEVWEAKCKAVLSGTAALQVLKFTQGLK